jgi:hypothetical protein
MTVILGSGWDSGGTIRRVQTQPQHATPQTSGIVECPACKATDGLKIVKVCDVVTYLACPCAHTWKVPGRPRRVFVL